jgi:hypothetical protein
MKVGNDGNDRNDRDAPELPALSTEARALAAQAAVVQAAPAGARERVLERLEGLVGPPGGGGGSSQAAPGLSSRPSRAPTATAVQRFLPLAASFLLGGVAGALAMRAASPAAPARVVREELTHAAAPPPLASVAGGAPAASAAQAAVAAPADPPRAPPVSTVTRSPLAAERALLDAARSAMEREDGAATLAATALHERRFPNGILVQEREALAVRALLLLGRKADAAARVARFRALFPDSVLLPTLEAAMAAAPEPVTNAAGSPQEGVEGTR